MSSGGENSFFSHAICDDVSRKDREISVCVCAYMCVNHYLCKERVLSFSLSCCDIEQYFTHLIIQKVEVQSESNVSEKGVSCLFHHPCSWWSLLKVPKKVNSKHFIAPIDSYIFRNLGLFSCHLSINRQFRHKGNHVQVLRVNSF